MKKLLIALMTTTAAISLAATAEAETGALAWAATRVRVTRIGPPSGDLILFAGETREHPHEHEHER